MIRFSRKLKGLRVFTFRAPTQSPAPAMTGYGLSYGAGYGASS